MFQSDPTVLPQSQADKLAAFLNGDECTTLRKVVRSHIAEQVVIVGGNSAENAEDYLRNGNVSQEAHEAIGKISRFSIFLKVLDEITNELKARNLTVTNKITVDQS